MTDDPYRELREAAERWAEQIANFKVPFDESTMREHAPAILALLAERKRLESEREEWTLAVNNTSDGLMETRAALRKSEERAAALAEALKPFASDVTASALAKALGHITREHMLNARATLTNEATNG